MSVKCGIDFTTAPSIQLTFIGCKEVEMGQESFHLNMVSKISLCFMGMMLVTVQFGC